MSCHGFIAIFINYNVHIVIHVTASCISQLAVISMTNLLFLCSFLFQKGIHLSIIAPRKIPALQRAFERVRIS